ncbi:hypothetical protein [Shewanella benthica]|nr:hypothetical protein [Shewanella benthica]
MSASSHQNGKTPPAFEIDNIGPTGTANHIHVDGLLLWDGT